MTAAHDGFHRRLHQVTLGGLSGQTAQTSGMRRLEAIPGHTSSEL